MFNKLWALTILVFLVACAPPINFQKIGASNTNTAPIQVSDPSAAPSENWVHCANESEVCYFSGIRSVRFGVSGNYVTKNYYGSVNCSVYIFGDPMYGVAKTCDVDQNSSSFTFEPMPMAQQIISPSTALSVDQVYDKRNFIAEAYGVPFDWGQSQNKANSYVEYIVEINAPGLYSIEMEVATNQSTAGFTFSTDTVDQGTLSISSSGAFNTYNFQTFNSIPFTAGVHRFRITKTGTISINIAAITLIKQ